MTEKCNVFSPNEKKLRKTLAEVAEHIVSLQEKGDSGEVQVHIKGGGVYVKTMITVRGKEIKE